MNIVQFVFSIRRLSLKPGQSERVERLSTVFIDAGEAQLGTERLVDTGALVERPMTLTAAQTACEPIVFTLSKDEPTLPVLASEVIEIDALPFLLRLDEVSFPPDAIAYRHTHPGPGFRLLRRGVLRLESDDHTIEAAQGDFWYEAANSPVRATPQGGHPETRFVRCMALPAEYQGKPTLTYSDPADARRPMLQTNHRHVDALIESWLSI